MHSAESLLNDLRNRIDNERVKQIRKLNVGTVDMSLEKQIDTKRNTKIELITENRSISHANSINSVNNIKQKGSGVDLPKAIPISNTRRIEKFIQTIHPQQNKYRYPTWINIPVEFIIQTQGTRIKQLTFQDTYDQIQGRYAKILPIVAVDLVSTATSYTLSKRSGTHMTMILNCIQWVCTLTCLVIQGNE